MSSAGGSRRLPDPVKNKTYYTFSPRESFSAPPFNSRPKLFCCPVAESDPRHLPRSFINPGRHLMNTQLQSFFECADNAAHTFAKCEVSHLIEVTTRVLQNMPDVPLRYEQWNAPCPRTKLSRVSTATPPFDDHGDDVMALEDDDAFGDGLPHSTYQSMSTRHFITQNRSEAWQAPPHSRSYRDAHADGTVGKSAIERYIEIPPLKTMPHTSDNFSAAPGGCIVARPWVPSCSVLMWCSTHNNLYEVHVLS